MRAMDARYDVAVVGGGTAGCILAARLAEDRSRAVCLLEAGPDYGPLAEGRWPSEILDARAMPFTHDWGTGGEDDRSLGARILGGSSAHNACVLVQGSPADYDEWGPEWRYEAFEPYLRRAETGFRGAAANTSAPSPFHLAALEAAEEIGLPRLTDANDPAQPVGVAPYPANVVDGRRWNSALAHLDSVRDRLTVVGGTLVDRVLLEGTRATGVVTAEGRRVEAGCVVLACGAYFSPAILLRSGVGPEKELRRLGIDAAAVLPVGETLLDHCGTGVAFSPTEPLARQLAEHESAQPLFEAHVLLKLASESCGPGTWNLHVLPWINRDPQRGGYELAFPVFHMKPASSGSVRLRSTDPAALPLVERGFLSNADDLPPLVEAVGVVRRLASAAPLRDLLDSELRPGDADPEQYIRETIRNYFHPVGTCAIGAVVDPLGRVLGLEGLVVADASIMPTIPRANTNLTTAAIAERIAETLEGP
jgi:choline dehydrogenase